MCVQDFLGRGMAHLFMHNAQTLDLQVSHWLPGNYSSHQAVQQETKFFFQFSCEKESPETHMSGGLKEACRNHKEHTRSR